MKVIWQKKSFKTVAQFEGTQSGKGAQRVFSAPEGSPLWFVSALSFFTVTDG